MKKDIFNSMINQVRTYSRANAPGILTGIGIVALWGAGIWAIKATPKAMTRLDERKEELETEDLGLVETIKTTGLIYAPALLTAGVGTACLICANTVSARRNAALATAYAISEKAIHEYKEKVVEKIGEKKEKAIYDEVAKDQVANNPVSNNKIFVTGKGETLCYDALMGRYFYGDIEKLRRAISDANLQLFKNDYISLNEVYDLIGLDYSRIGEDLGWNIGKNEIECLFSSHLDENDNPCLVFDFVHRPIYEYYR